MLCANSRTVIQITKTCTTLTVHTALQCVYSHIHVSLVGQILWAGKAEKGKVTLPLMTTYGANSKSALLSFNFYKGRAGYLVLVLHITPFLATGGPQAG